MKKQLLAATTLGMALILTGCGTESQESTIEKKEEPTKKVEVKKEPKLATGPDLELKYPVVDADEVKVTSGPVKVTPKTGHSSYDPTARVLTKLDSGNVPSFSVLPVSQDETHVTFKVGPRYSDSKIMKENGLVFLIDGTVYAYSAEADGTHFKVDKKTLGMLNEIESAMIQLYFEKGLAFEGDYHLGENNTFKTAIENFLNTK